MLEQKGASTNTLNVEDSEEIHADDKLSVPAESRICIVGQKLKMTEHLVHAAESFNIPVVFTDDPKDYMYDDTNYDTGYVLEEFEGEVYNMLFKADLRIWGPTVIMKYAALKKEVGIVYLAVSGVMLQLDQKYSRVRHSIADGTFFSPTRKFETEYKGFNNYWNVFPPLPFNPRPLYCTAMQNLIVSFTGFRDRAELSRLVSYVHHMGGSIRKEFSERITHLVAKSTNNDKYKYAITFGIPVMTDGWIHKTWERRFDPSCSAAEDEMLKYKMLPFHLCRIVFLGFSPEEQKHMEELTKQNGGEVTNIDDDLRTHLVFEDQCNVEVSQEQAEKVYLLRAEWFWTSIQMDCCADESLYLYHQNSATPHSQPVTGTPLTPGSKLRKRKRLKETLGQLAQLPDIDVGPGKRRSTDILATSLENSFLDATTSPDRNEIHVSNEPATPKTPNIKSPPEIKNLTARQQVCLELLQTENNYVGILNTIMTVFKIPLEAQEQVGGPLLDPTEVKIIFGNLEPIVDVHRTLRDDLTMLVANWREDSSVGNVVLKHSQALLKAYPSFVNFFEKTKEVLQLSDRTKPRFHAFLKICQSKPECGRQSLIELLIRPVQRLPSIILLLTDLLKHTSKSNPDHMPVEEAIKRLKEVLTHINEDKRKTEGQVAMFDIINDIENCPPNLLSSHRTFITKADMVELSDSISGKGDHLTMFLFSDMLEICKRRTKLMGSLKSPSTLNLATAPNRTRKCYKHLELMPVSHIKRVVDIRETGECKNVFALVYRSNQEMRERLYTFALVGPDVTKCQFLKTMCRHLANSICRADAENFLTCLDPQELDIDTSEVNTNSLSKAVSRLASKTSRRVGRAFSFNRTPRNLKRAMSTIISPFHSPSSETPAALSQRLGCHYPSNSAADLQEMDSPPPKVAFKITKLKSSSLGASSSKLL